MTGAMSGIGKAVAQNLARQGAHVVLHGRDQARGEALVDSGRLPRLMCFVGGRV
ncbi:SDR family NAD(P)-dependent oxidoreductase [Streptomyces durocortorensis]|uniref:SDR family NAD(P)-dependent oxidoreductase n=1 Tax=Streptomyces durocortorensis TaxID=2811104 RepID=UPI0027DD05EE|nr:SDR family NAD(P)-dependent oxidoreductase [Streptomyces durocortorensis]